MKEIKMLEVQTHKYTDGRGLEVKSIEIHDKHEVYERCNRSL